MSNTRIKKIEEQLAFLKWRKMQNERSVKASLETSRALSSKDAMSRVAKNRQQEKIKFLSAVALDELHRPLVIEDEEMARIQHEESVNKERAFMVRTYILYSIINIYHNAWFIYNDSYAYRDK